jgi:hypothetical protein
LPRERAATAMAVAATHTITALLSVVDLAVVATPARAASSEARAAGTLSPESVAGLGSSAAEARNPRESARLNEAALTVKEFLPMNATAHHLSPSRAVRLEPAPLLWDLTAPPGGSAASVAAPTPE